MKVIITENAPLPLGPYSQGILSGNLVFTAGQIGVDPKTGKLAEGFENQVVQALKNLEAILNKAGASKCSILKVTVYLKNINRFKDFNKIYEEFNDTIKKFGLKKSPTLLKLMEYFVKNPERVLFEK
ncbi:MAG: Rid family detoxifying hydrolase [Desulfurobacteriaceae bacterium]